MSDKLIAEKCDKCGLLKAGDLHQFPICAVDALKTLGDKNRALEAEIERLSNPWVSVEDRLPNHGDTVFGLNNLLGAWSEEWDEDEPIGDMTHWMPIPEII